MATQKQQLEEALRRAEQAEAEVASLKQAQAADDQEQQPRTATASEHAGDEDQGLRTDSASDGEQELRKDSMMRHLLDSLAQGQDIGHYGRLVFAMVARHFLPADEVLGWLTRDRDFSEEQAHAMLAQVEARDYNPPRRDRILEWQAQQEFPILPDPDDPDCGNLYRNLKFPDTIYHHIEQYQEQKLGAE